MEAVQELAPLVGVAQACQVLDVPRGSYYRSRQPKRPPLLSRPRPRHPRALTPSEQDRVRNELNSERFVDRAPRAVYATLLDEGVYLCHWRTMYRLLHADQATRERRLVRRHPVYQRPELLATAPRQIWSWDITRLRGPVAGVWYSLYVVLDIFSRMVVGWTVAEREDALVAEQVLADAYLREAIGPEQLTVHADRGAPMTSKVLADLMEDLGITKSHSRPSVSDDNPYSEAQFKTMKYGATYPERFASLADARVWVAGFVTWYTTEHRHEGIGLLPPIVVHQGQAVAVTEARQTTLDDAQATHPERFVRGRPHPPQVPQAVWINPPTSDVRSAAPAASAAPVSLAAPASRVSAASAAP
jgi:putative transposase